MLGRVEALHTAARARAMAAFTASRRFEADGLGRPGHGWWLVPASPGAAAGAAVRWSKRLAAHPAVAAALAAGDLSPSWAQALCRWTDLLPGDALGSADVILLARRPVARTWRTWLSWLRRSALAPPRPMPMTGTATSHRWVRLSRPWAGPAWPGDLTPACAAALPAVLAA